jgi:uncharacterized protein YjbK
MTTAEFELKWLLHREHYEKLVGFLNPLPSLCELQTNYYYDTPTEKLRKQNITIRIREKDGKLQGTVKRHLAQDGCSMEERFQVESIPYRMTFEGEPVYLVGKLQTMRTTFFLSDSVMIMLDRNEYLDCVDYELELECPKDFMERGEGILFLIQQILQAGEREQAESKSERFFRRLEFFKK